METNKDNSGNVDFSGLTTPEEMYSHIESKINLELVMAGIKNYVRQKPIGPYFADFFFLENNLVLEIDGVIGHSTEDQRLHDQLRDRYMNESGFCVVRVTGKVAAYNPSGVLSSVRYLHNNITYFINSEDDIKRLILESVKTETKRCPTCDGKGIITIK